MSLHPLNLSAKKPSLVVQKSARNPVLALKGVYLVTTVLPLISAEWESLKLVRFTVLTCMIQLTFPVSCVASSECSHLRNRTLCRESPKTGTKTCQKPSKSSCEDGCAPGEFCSTENKCDEGKFLSPFTTEILKSSLVSRCVC